MPVADFLSALLPDICHHAPFSCRLFSKHCASEDRRDRFYRFNACVWLIIVAAHFRNVGYLAMIFGTIFSDIIRPYRELLRCGRVFRDIRMHVSKRRVIAAIAKTGLYLLIVVAEICAVCSIAWMLFGSFGNGMALLKEWLGNIDNLSKLYVPFILFAAGMNVVSFLAFWLDKRYAVRQKWRIKESTLFVISILFGAVGAVLGMRVFRHKTKKLGFVVLLPIL